MTGRGWDKEPRNLPNDDTTIFRPQNRKIK